MKDEKTQSDEGMNIQGLDQQGIKKLLNEKEAALQDKSRLIDNMAYQIRTLSNAVIGFSDLMLTEDLTDDQMEYIEEINQAGQGLSSLVNEVLDWAQLESGRMKVTLGKCDLSEIIKEIEGIFRNAAGERGIGYELTVDPDLPAYIQSDTDRILKCLINLAANAVRHTSEGQVRLGVNKETRDGQLWIRFEVGDTGCGLNEEQVGRVFEPVLHHEEANAEVLTMLDMGLTVTAGLPLTKQLAEALGGGIEVQSELNVGSTFSLLIPAGVEEAQGPRLGMPVQKQQFETPAQPESIQPAQTDNTPEVILLVEDQPSNRTVISLMLEALGVEVETAEDGVEGVAKASEKQYSLILMDLKMPRMDGYEATRQIREKGIETPIVALSAKVLNEDEHLKISSSFDGFVTKPVGSQMLMQTVQRFIPELWGNQLEEIEIESAPDSDEEVITFEYGN